ncbi:hypothetical protein [Nonomuraea africana]|uniref:Uncharacterized protein n=2 Tax=Nonomuraea africana TaxID=46171 RepID=A0ABR9KR49_9ACTN|nr:hypothetical protein [Nonomuraea africana]MBE1564494.1 hypothetical protein [Nonomuraea africana]
MKRTTMFAMAGSLSMALLTPLAPAANAASADDDGHRKCKPNIFFKIHQLSPRNFFVPRTRFTDGPGGEMTVSVTREHEVTAFIETESERTREVTTGDLVRSLRRMGLPHLEERHMVFTGHEYTREVSKGMFGNMWYRVFGYRIGWSQWSVLGTCRQVLIDTGIANVPARVEGWHYWETKHPEFRGHRLWGGHGHGSSGKGPAGNGRTAGKGGVKLTTPSDRARRMQPEPGARRGQRSPAADED